MLFHLIELLTEQSGDDGSYFLLVFRSSEWAERTIKCSIRPTNIPSVAGKNRHFDWDVNVVKAKMEQEGANNWERALTLRTTRTLIGHYHTLWETFLSLCQIIGFCFIRAQPWLSGSSTSLISAVGGEVGHPSTICMPLSVTREAAG